MSRKLVFQIVLFLYVIASAIYIAQDTWATFKATQIQKAFADGRRMAIEQVIEQAQNPNCQPFSVFADEKQTQLINVGCLHPAAQTPPASTPAE